MKKFFKVRFFEDFLPARTGAAIFEIRRKSSGNGFFRGIVLINEIMTGVDGSIYGII